VTTEFRRDEMYELCHKCDVRLRHFRRTWPKASIGNTTENIAIFLSIALGSRAELEAQIEIVRDLKFIGVEAWTFSWKNSFTNRVCS